MHRGLRQNLYEYGEFILMRWYQTFVLFFGGSYLFYWVSESGVFPFPDFFTKYRAIYATENERMAIDTKTNVLKNISASCYPTSD